MRTHSQRRKFGGPDRRTARSRPQAYTETRQNTTVSLQPTEARSAPPASIKNCKRTACLRPRVRHRPLNRSQEFTCVKRFDQQNLFAAAIGNLARLRLDISSN